jgi:glucan biosynthesis protein
LAENQDLVIGSRWEPDKTGQLTDNLSFNADDENYRVILSSEREPHRKNPAIVKQTKTGHGLQMGARHQDRLAD